MKDLIDEVKALFVFLWAKKGTVIATVEGFCLMAQEFEWWTWEPEEQRAVFGFLTFLLFGALTQVTGNARVGNMIQGAVLTGRAQAITDVNTLADAAFTIEFGHQAGDNLPPTVTSVRVEREDGVTEIIPGTTEEFEGDGEREPGEQILPPDGSTPPDGPAG